VCHTDGPGVPKKERRTHARAHGCRSTHSRQPRKRVACAQTCAAQGNHHTQAVHIADGFFVFFFKKDEPTFLVLFHGRASVRARGLPARRKAMRQGGARNCFVVAQAHCKLVPLRVLGWRLSMARKPRTHRCGTWSKPTERSQSELSAHKAIPRPRTVNPVKKVCCLLQRARQKPRWCSVRCT
jgi:hypothetical protein